MAEELKVLWILAIGLSFACITGYIASRLKLSPILGYLIAGFLIGPNSPGFIADQYISDQLANIGVALLMFAVGLNFNWKDIKDVQKIVVPGALLLCGISIFAGILLCSWLGQTTIQGLVIGLAICVSSTVVIVRTLADQNLLHTKQGHIVIGWTIVEDLVSVLGLILLPALALSSVEANSAVSTLFSAIGSALLKLILLVGILYLVGEKAVQKILKIVARTRSHELFTLAILSLVFLIAAACSSFFGISLALGAFIAGTVVGKTELSHQAAANALPMRDAFAVIFFLSVGMLFDPKIILSNMPLFTGILAILLIIRPFVAYFVLKAARLPRAIGYTLAIAITQIGEYSFILAEEGHRLGILPNNAYDILVACAFVTISLNPILFTFFKPFMTTSKRPHKNPKGYLEDLYEHEKQPSSFLPTVLVIGYGPVGKSCARFLAKTHQVLVIDQNIDTVTATGFKETNIQLFFGDATSPHLLEHVHIETIQLVVITTPDLEITKHIVEAIQEVNPHAKMIARSHYKRDLQRSDFGDIPVICDEEVTAEKMIEAICLKTQTAMS
jgi:monovalent cation:H+ antiporter-2, CPA2 family